METLNSIQAHLNQIKEVFLTPDYDDYLHGYIVEDHIYAIEDLLHKELKKHDSSN